MADWHQVHDFARGWGLLEHLPGNEEVIDQGGDGLFAYRVVRSRVRPRHVWAHDAARLLGLDLFAPGVDLEDIYARLQPLLEAEAVTPAPAWRCPDVLRLPAFALDREPGRLDVRAVLADNPLKDND